MVSMSIQTMVRPNSDSLGGTMATLFSILQAAAHSPHPVHFCRSITIPHFINETPYRLIRSTRTTVDCHELLPLSGSTRGPRHPPGEPQVRSLGPFSPPPLRPGNRGFLQQGRKAGGGRKEELLSPLPVQGRVFPRIPPAPLFPEQTPEVRERRVAVHLPAPFPQILQKLQGNLLEIRRPLPRGEDLLHPLLDVLSVRFLAASREQVDARLPPQAEENFSEGGGARQRGDDRLLKAQLGEGKIRDRQRQVPLLQVRGQRQHEIGMGRGIIDQCGELDDGRNPGK